MATLDDIKQAKQTVRDQLLQRSMDHDVANLRRTNLVAEAAGRAAQHVHAVGIGRKNGTGEMCVRFYVVQKLPEGMLRGGDVLPKAIDGVPTDVIEAPPAFAMASGATEETSEPACSVDRKTKLRPIIGGISCGNPDITDRTLGCFCRSTKQGDDPQAIFALSNNHVFANVNQAELGDPLYQPGPADGGTADDTFAKLHRYVTVQLGDTTPNLVDAAIGAVLPNLSCTDSICRIGELTGTIESEEGMLIRKQGRTTGYAEGKIDDIEYDVVVGMTYDSQALFHDQLRLVPTDSHPIGLGGDSGSAVVHRSKPLITGLYFAGPGDGSYGIANKIQNVMQELEIGFS